MGIALDLGTSGFRGQLIDIGNRQVLATAITARHPLPGANVIDHLNFALEVGTDTAQTIVLAAINQVVDHLIGLGEVKLECLAVCGNPIQLSLFENIEIRDLAFAGEKKQQLLDIVPPDRGSKEYRGERFPALKIPRDCLVLIPPAVKHEIGADALALLVLSGILEQKKISLATDYGTNAEIALKVDDKIITGSCAAGPALEGQHIARGMLAAPGAIADLVPQAAWDRCLILDEKMMPLEGDLVRLDNGAVLDPGPTRARGITGTGVIAAVSRGLARGLIKLPRIDTASTFLKLADEIRFGEDDLAEAGKAIGAIRAGYITLAADAGITADDIEVAFMAGASGTYVDAHKALHVGMVPPLVNEIYQVGNTSLILARMLVQEPQLLQFLENKARELRASHCMFGNSKVFEKAYLLEISYWTEGLPWSDYEKYAAMYRLPHLSRPRNNPRVIKKVLRDISETGPGGIKSIEKVGMEGRWEIPGCSGCGRCVEECPEAALFLDVQKGITIRMDRCSGTACRRCEHACPERVFHLPAFWRQVGM
ncbi:MAG: methylamine methyltransferase corrinoid protein reductive activase [Bacillota bacterium]